MGAGDKEIPRADNRRAKKEGNLGEAIGGNRSTVRPFDRSPSRE
jgi:hypothetical protein